MNIGKYIHLIGTFAVGFFFCWFFFRPEIKVVTDTVTKTDTVYVTKIDTIRVNRTQLKHEYLRDTVVIDFKPKISLFETTFHTIHGNAYLSGEVIGEVLKSDLITDFKIPVVTNTITNTRTIMKKEKGLFLGPGLVVDESNFSPTVNADYLNGKSLVGYSYDFRGIHSVRLGRKVF